MNAPLEGMNEQQKKTMQFLANLVKNYGDRLDMVAQEPFFMAAAGHMNFIGETFKKESAEDK
jgi:hypothetical protein